MHRSFLFLSVLTSESNAEESASSVNHSRASDVSTVRPVDLTTTDGSTATVRILSFDHDGMQVSYDDGRVRRVSYNDIDSIRCARVRSGIRVIAVGSELAILTKAGPYGVQLGGVH
ncbi:MAG: hypothetical protein AAGF72_15110 [Pseudomonadota bacterium]